MSTTPTIAPPDPTQVDIAAPAEIAGPVHAAGAPRGGAHIVGAFSIEKFCNAGALSYTHEDASGFLQWLQSSGNTRNFWFADAGVKIWAYYEQYDNWQDTYGMDADLISYHSGHGAMDANGVFYAPMGAAWAGNDCTAYSNNMVLGNEYLRYLFWSTCLSLRVLDGHSPLRTWGQRARGTRMIFGFETVSWDDSRYGSNFGSHWNRGESLSSAWLNGSWDIAHDQAPSVAAFGATAAEAQDRVYNERFFQWGTVSSAWMWWRWYNVARSAAREPNRALPASLQVARLAPARARVDRDLAARFGYEAGEGNGSFAAGNGSPRLVVAPDGSLSARLAEPNRHNRTALDPRQAEMVAAETVRRYGLDAEGSLVLDRVVETREGGGSDGGSGERQGPFTTGTLIQYRQLINGLPVITPNAGTLRVHVDNDGTPTDVVSTLRSVDSLSERPRASASEPTPPNGAPASTGEPPEPEDALARAFSERLRSLAFKGDLPVSFGIVPGTTEVGYDVQGDDAVLTAQRAVELDFGRGLKTRYWIKAPLFG